MQEPATTPFRHYSPKVQESKREQKNKGIRVRQIDLLHGPCSHLSNPSWMVMVTSMYVHPTIGRSSQLKSLVGWFIISCKLCISAWFCLSPTIRQINFTITAWSNPPYFSLSWLNQTLQKGESFIHVPRENNNQLCSSQSRLGLSHVGCQASASFLWKVNSFPQALTNPDLYWLVTMSGPINQTAGVLLQTYAHFTYPALCPPSGTTRSQGRFFIITFVRIHSFHYSLRMLDPSSRLESLKYLYTLHHPVIYPQSG